MAAVLSQVTDLRSLSSKDTVVNPNFASMATMSSDLTPCDSPVSPLDNSNCPSPGQTNIKVDIVNVLCNFKTHCHLDLRTIAMRGINVEFRRDPSSVVMKLRRPAITATIWSSGKVICMGARSEAESLLGARRVARKLQVIGFKLRFVDFQVKNVLGVVNLPFGVRIDRLKDAYSREVSYEPELHPAASWRLVETGGQLQVFQTGNLSVTAPNVDAAQKTFQIIYPRLFEFRKAKDSGEAGTRAVGKKATALAGPPADKAKRQKTKSGDVTPLKAFNLPAEFDDIDWDETDGVDAD